MCQLRQVGSLWIIVIFKTENKLDSCNRKLTLVWEQLLEAVVSSLWWLASTVGTSPPPGGLECDSEFYCCCCELLPQWWRRNKKLVDAFFYCHFLALSSSFATLSQCHHCSLEINQIQTLIFSKLLKKKEDGQVCPAVCKSAPLTLINGVSPTQLSSDEYESAQLPGWRAKRKPRDWARVRRDKR